MTGVSTLTHHQASGNGGAGAGVRLLRCQILQGGRYLRRSSVLEKSGRRAHTTDLGLTVALVTDQLIIFVICNMGFRITVECLIVLTLVFSGSCYAESFPCEFIYFVFEVHIS